MLGQSVLSPVRFVKETARTGRKALAFLVVITIMKGLKKALQG
ncbi:hypothetical protein VCHENC03_3276 [Vibrio sp. HENC-03]|nr:hypothetical protein VCHENC03_3276 [Vibrio sp. HENC-03]